MSARTIANLRGASRGRLGESACTDQYLLRAFSSETTPISPVFGPGLRFPRMCGDDRTAGVEELSHILMGEKSVNEYRMSPFYASNKF